MNQIYLSETYKNIYSLPIGMKAISHTLKVGPVHISIEKRKKTYCGRLNVNGVISGLSQMFRDLKLQTGMIFTYKNHAIDSITLEFTNDVVSHVVPGNTFADSPSSKLTWPHNEIFTPDNFHRWKPINELDVCFVFGLFYNKTGYNYCRALNSEYIDKIEYFTRVSSASKKPDSILHHQESNRYLLAKFGINSSEYKQLYTSNDVDVLVVWIDDEKDRSQLPKHVVGLYQLAKQAALYKH